jgi:hypothetical protein
MSAWNLPDVGDGLSNGAMRWWETECSNRQAGRRG